jgi:hypothetical protein
LRTLGVILALLFQITRPVSVWAEAGGTAAFSAPGGAGIGPANDGEKPAWLGELSLTLKESYDDNVFLAGAAPNALPPSYTVPPGSVAALKDESSWVTTISPKIGFDASSFVGAEWCKALSLTYAPDFSFYHNASSETFEAHRFLASAKAKSGTYSFSVDDAFAYVHGNDVGPFYPGNLLSAIGIAAPRERREQIQDRGALAFEYTLGHWFIRPVASLLYYDLMTFQTNVIGYINYVDRYDVNGGADLGYRLGSELALSVGYRYGYQYQEKLNFSPYSSSGNYQRVLAGICGHPWHWLEFNLQGGPDFRDYPQDTATHIMPVDDKHLITYYGEASVAVKPTPKDTVAFKYKQFLWVSSIGKVPYFDSCYVLSYQRPLIGRLSLDLAGKLLSADYTVGNLSACKRDDLQYTISVGLGYALGKHANLSFAYSLDLGRNGLNGIPQPAAREYDHNLFSLGGTLKF